MLVGDLVVGDEADGVAIVEEEDGVAVEVHEHAHSVWHPYARAPALHHLAEGDEVAVDILHVCIHMYIYIYIYIHT